MALEMSETQCLVTAAGPSRIRTGFPVRRSERNSATDHHDSERQTISTAFVRQADKTKQEEI